MDRRSFIRNGSLALAGVVLMPARDLNIASRRRLLIDRLIVPGVITLAGAGTFKTANSGQRVEITATDTDRISLFSGSSAESGPGTLYVRDLAGVPAITLSSPQNSSGNVLVEIELRGGAASSTDHAVLIGPGVATYFQVSGSGNDPIYVRVGGALRQVTRSASTCADAGHRVLQTT